MTKDDLQSATKEEVFAFIRQRLSFGNSIENHLRQVDKELFRKELDSPKFCAVMRL